MNVKHVACVIAGVACSLPALSQPMEAPGQRIAAQRDAMSKLAALDGIWRGKATTTLPDGKQHEITQTERVGSFLDGSIKLVEGRGYEADGKVAFNALGVISYNPATRVYTMHSNAQGYTGNFVVTPLADGFSWEIPAGPMTIKYTATIKDETWREIGERIMPGKEAVRMFEMTLKRIGSTSWPAGDAVPAK
ncbi:MAG: DUF1579 domain-containing protein [Telluria sp.]